MAAVGPWSFEMVDPPQAMMRISSEAKKAEKPDAQVQVGDAKDVDFGRAWHLPLCFVMTLGDQRS